MYHVGTKIKMFNGAAGTVVGYGTVDRKASLYNIFEDVTPVYLIELEEGFWRPANDCYVSVLAVHENSLENI